MANDKRFVVVGFPPGNDCGGEPPSSVVDLGAYIFATNPYHAVFPPDGEWKRAYPRPVIAVEEAYAKDDVLYALDSTGIEQHEKPGTWKFKYADHYVDRAVRIPYMYYIKSERTKGDKSPKLKRPGGDEQEPKDVYQIVLVRDYILIGFEGGAGY